MTQTSGIPCRENADPYPRARLKIEAENATIALRRGAPRLPSGEFMSRVSIKSKDDLPAELRPLWDKMTTYGAFENQAGGMAHRPPIFKHIWSLLVDLADEAVLSKRHLELALVTVSLLNQCDYCVSHHAPKLAIQGVSEQGAERLLDYKDHPELDAVDRLVVEYSIAVTSNWNKTRDEIFTPASPALFRSPDCRTDLAHLAVRRVQPFQRRPAIRYRAGRAGPGCR